ncbi:MAG: PP2C family protein-serine/threonine phosphatase [Bdellovibrionota bacterium]
MTNSLLEPNKDILDRISHCVITDVGKKRETNQDSFIAVCGENFKLFVVCDGMGGTDGGEIAAGITISYLQSELSGKKINDIEDVKEVVFLANKHVFDYGAEHKEVQGLGTTITTLLVMAKGSWILNVGDSRVYKIVANSMEQITQDDTVLQELIKSGAVSKEKAKSHPIANMLTKTIGQGDSLEIESKRIGFLDDSELYLLCSDGLYNMLSDEEILKIIKESSPQEAVKKLVEEANDNGGADNITVMIVGTFEEELNNTTNVDNDFSSKDKPKIKKPKEIVTRINYKNLSQKVFQAKLNEDGNAEQKNDDYKTSQNNKNIDKENIDKEKPREITQKDLYLSNTDSKKFIRLFLLSLSIILLLIFMPAKNNKNAPKEKEKKLVGIIGDIKVVEKEYKFKMKDIEKKVDTNTTVNYIKVNYTEEEKKAYDDILNLLQEKKELSKRFLQNEKNILLTSIKEAERKIEKLAKKEKELRGYNGQSLIDIASKISLKDKKKGSSENNNENNGVKKALDDFLNFSYSILDKNLSQKDYDSLMSAKIKALNERVEKYVYNNLIKLKKSVKETQEKILLSRLNLSLVNLKLEYVQVLQSGDEEALENFKLKIEALRERL